MNQIRVDIAVGIQILSMMLIRVCSNFGESVPGFTVQVFFLGEFGLGFVKSFSI